MKVLRIHELKGDEGREKSKAHFNVSGKRFTASSDDTLRKMVCTGALDMLNYVFKMYKFSPTAGNIYILIMYNILLYVVEED
jgi:hypothetical protein